MKTNTHTVKNTSDRTVDTQTSRVLFLNIFLILEKLLSKQIGGICLPQYPTSLHLLQSLEMTSQSQNLP